MDSWIYDRRSHWRNLQLCTAPAPWELAELHHQNTPSAATSRRHNCAWAPYDLKEASVGLNRRLAAHPVTVAQRISHAWTWNHRDAGSWTQGTHAVNAVGDLAAVRPGRGITTCWLTSTVDTWIALPLGHAGAQPAGARAAIDEGTRFQNYNSADGLYAQRVQWLRSVAQWRVSDALQLRNTFYVRRPARLPQRRDLPFNASNTAVARTGVLRSGTTRTWWATASKAPTAAPWRGTPATGPLAWTEREPANAFQQPGPDGQHRGPNHFTQEPFDIPAWPQAFAPTATTETTTTALYLENCRAWLPTVSR